MFFLIIDKFDQMFVFMDFQTNLPVFRVKESSVRRRYSDFEWLRNELERDSKVIYRKYSDFDCTVKLGYNELGC